MLMDKITVSSPVTGKLTHLKHSLSEMGSAVIAFSGGVDSTLLAVIATEVLGEKAISVFASSPVVADTELADARALAATLKLNFREISHDQMQIPAFTCNDKDRCYHCKKDLIQHLKKLAEEQNITSICEGSNYDDLGDYRPGLKSIAETGARSPLAEACLTKAEIRSLAHERGLDNWARPASPCLASRIPYGTRVTIQTIERIDKGERLLRTMGLQQVRLRHHGDIARIEVMNADILVLLEMQNREKLIRNLKELGYKYVTIDVEGFRSGSLNEVL